MKRYHILLLGNYDGTNIGDNCILSDILDKFATHASEICIPSRYTEFVARKYHINSVRLPSLRFILEFLKSDIVLIGGGGIFSRYVGPYAKFLPLFAILAKLFGKRVIYYGIGVYNTTPFLVRELVKISMLFSDDISIRDKASFNTISFVKRIKRVRLVTDPGLTLKPICVDDAKRLLLNEGITLNRILVGISLKYTMDERVNFKIVSEFSEFIDWLIEKFNAEIVFFPFSFNPSRTIENDFAIAKQIYRRLKSKKNNFRIIRAYKYTPREIKGIVGLMSVFIGMRYHSIIFAYSMGVPLFGVSYEEKCRDFLESRCLQFVDAGHITFNILRQFFLDNIVKDEEIEG